MSDEHRRYVLWGLCLCALLLVFSLVMEWVGLKPFSVGQGMTTACLAVASIVLAVVYYRTGK